MYSYLSTYTYSTIETTIKKKNYTLKTEAETYTCGLVGRCNAAGRTKHVGRGPVYTAAVRGAFFIYKKKVYPVLRLCWGQP
jgi:hypothetical protein